jgi:CDP-diacylglycerol--glycerol-3-phosphate 3-phosphatidyltransferase
MGAHPGRTVLRITLARLAASPLFVLLFVAAVPVPSAVPFGVNPVTMGAALLVLVAQELADAIAARIAAGPRGDSELRPLLDPLADSLTHLGAFLCLMWAGLVPVWLLVVMVYREGLVTALRVVAARRGVIIGPRFTSQLKAICQGVAAGTIVLLVIMATTRPGIPARGIAEVCSWILMLVNVASLVDYYLAFKRTSS